MYRCPKCKSHKVEVGYPKIVCLVCGYQESLVDYPVSYDFHRAMSVRYNDYDPGYFPIKERVSTVEPSLDSQQLQKQIDQLTARAIYLQNKVNQHLDKSKKGDNSAF